MASFASLCHLLCLLICLTTIHAAATAAASTKSAQLVDEVCKRASNYTFCVNALYSDPLTEHASGLEQLAGISVRLAYNNAASTQSHIDGLLLKNASSPGGQSQRLLRCRDDYAEAVKVIEIAATDVNSEDFYELPDLASDVTILGDDCETTFQGTPSPPLGNSNQNVKGLCEIFAIIARLLTSGYPPE